MTATSVNTAEVAIVGGGPVGMMLALFLDRHGVKTVLFNIEQDTRWHPKGSTHNSRTMEHYRRLGISRSIRALGLPPEHQTDVSYFTRYNSHELARIYMPSEREKIRSVVAAPRTHQNFEPIHRANQMYVEQFLSGHVRTRKNIQLRYGWQVDQFTESDDGVVLQAHRVQKKMPITLTTSIMLFKRLKLASADQPGHRNPSGRPGVCNTWSVVMAGKAMCEEHLVSRIRAMTI